jgi:hypothetical protein
MICTACPYCLIMLGDAAGAPAAVQDVAEILVEAIVPR